MPSVQEDGGSTPDEFRKKVDAAKARIAIEQQAELEIEREQQLELRRMEKQIERTKAELRQAKAKASSRFILSMLGLVVLVVLGTMLFLVLVQQRSR